MSEQRESVKNVLGREYLGGIDGVFKESELTTTPTAINRPSSDCSTPWPKDTNLSLPSDKLLEHKPMRLFVPVLIFHYWGSCALG